MLVEFKKGDALSEVFDSKRLSAYNHAERQDNGHKAEQPKKEDKIRRSLKAETISKQENGVGKYSTDNQNYSQSNPKK